MLSCFSHRESRMPSPTDGIFGLAKPLVYSTYDFEFPSLSRFFILETPPD